VDNLSLITTHNVHQAIIADLEASFSSLTRHSPSRLADKPLPEPVHNSDPVPDYLQSAIQPAYSAIQESPHDHAGNTNNTIGQSYMSHFPVVDAAPHTADHLKGSFFKLLSRKKKQKDNFPGDMESSFPPQTPPKDSKNVMIHPMLVTRSDIRPPRTDKILQRQRSRSMSDFASSANFHAPDSQAIIDAPENRHSQDGAQLLPLPLPGKWARKDANPDPKERARRRCDLKLQKEREEQALMKEEAERQRRLKLEKEMVLRQEKEEEARRLAEVEQELSRIRLERRRREQSEKEEEERQRRELEDRKQRDKKRRMEQHQRAEEWRRQQAQKVEAAAREAAEIQKREEGKRRDKIQRAEAIVKQTKGERDLTGWITMQSRDTVSWRRRYFKFVGTTILHWSAKVNWPVLIWLLELILMPGSGQDMTAPLEKIDLRDNVGGLKEWYEGYEDLEAIPFSLVVEFKDGRVPLSMYADSEEEKVSILMNTFELSGLGVQSINF
jgi:hypothetical protein